MHLRRFCVLSIISLKKPVIIVAFLVASALWSAAAQEDQPTEEDARRELDKIIVTTPGKTTVEFRLFRDLCLEPVRKHGISTLPDPEDGWSIPSAELLTPFKNFHRQDGVLFDALGKTRGNQLLINMQSVGMDSEGQYAGIQKVECSLAVVNDVKARRYNLDLDRWAKHSPHDSFLVKNGDWLDRFWPSTAAVRGMDWDFWSHGRGPSLEGNFNFEDRNFNFENREFILINTKENTKDVPIYIFKISYYFTEPKQGFAAATAGIIAPN